MSDRRMQVVLEIIWSEGSVPKAEVYGPWEAADDESHLGDVREFMQEWRRLTGCAPERVTMAIVRDPAEWIGKMRVVPR